MNNFEITIDKAEKKDAKRLADFAGNAFREAYTGTMDEKDINTYINKNFISSEIEQQIIENKMQFYLAFDKRTLVGYTKLRSDRTRKEFSDKKAIELERIYIERRHYRCGLGAQLFNQAIQTSRKDGFEVLWLAVWQKNDRALSFYKKMGMKIFGVQHFTVGNLINDDFVLQLAL